LTNYCTSVADILKLRGITSGWFWILDFGFWIGNW
jgi:hypothetical protein